MYWHCPYLAVTYLGSRLTFFIIYYLISTVSSRFEGKKTGITYNLSFFFHYMDTIILSVYVISKLIRDIHENTTIYVWKLMLSMKQILWEINCNT